MTIDRPVLLVGATGTSGTLIARALAAAGIPLMLAARRAEPLHALAQSLAATAIGDFDLARPDAAVAGAAAVVNAAGPFTATTGPLLRACLDSGIPYVDIANEFAAVGALLDRAEEARAAGVALVTGAGFGPAVGESLLGQLLPTLTDAPLAVRVVIAPAAETPSPAVQATVERVAAEGAVGYVDGELRRAPFGSGQTEFHFGGHDWTVLPVATADLAVARRMTAAPDVTAYFAAPGSRPADPEPTSYAHIEIDTASGTLVRTATVGRGVQATAAIAAAVTHRLLTTDAAAGAWTPVTLFGATFTAEATGLRVLPAEQAGARRP